MAWHHFGVELAIYAEVLALMLKWIWSSLLEVLDCKYIPGFAVGNKQSWVSNKIAEAKT